MKKMMMINKIYLKINYFFINIMKIITSVINANYIEIQYLSLKKFLKNDFEYIIFNDAKNFNDSTNNNDLTIKKKVIDTCKKLNIQCINHNNDFHINMKSASFRHATVLNLMLEYQKNNPDEYLYIDNDIFLIDYLDINKYRKYDTAIVLQHRNINNIDINYIWPGLCYFNKNISNINLLNWNLANGCDTGGMTYKWLLDINNSNTFPTTKSLRTAKNNEIYNNDKIYFINHLWASSWEINELPDNLNNNKKFVELLVSDVRNKNNKISCELYDSVFLHYRGGSNWNSNVDIELPNMLIDIFNLKK